MPILKTSDVNNSTLAQRGSLDVLFAKNSRKTRLLHRNARHIALCSISAFVIAVAFYLL